MTKDTKIKLEILIALVVAMGFVALAPYYIRLLPESKPLRLILGNMVVYALMGGLCLLRCRKLNANPWMFLGFSGEHLGKQLLWGLLVGLFSMAALVGLPLLVLRNPAFVLGSKEALFMVPLRIVFYMLFVGPVEEIIFRGYLFRRVEELTDRPGTVCLVTALLFGLWHFPVNLNLIQVAFTGLVGLIYAAFYTRFKNCSLISVSVAHGLHDMGIMLLGLLLL